MARLLCNVHDKRQRSLLQTLARVAFARLLSIIVAKTRKCSKKLLVLGWFLVFWVFSISCDYLLSEWVCSDGVNGSVLYSNLKGVSRLLVRVHKLSGSVMPLSAMV